MQTYPHRFLGIAVLFSTLSFIGCGILAPFEDRKSSLDGLKRAETYQAQTYAQESYEKALKYHEDGEALIVTNKKSRKNEKAKEAYLQSISNSSAAILIAIELHVTELLKQAEASLSTFQKNGVDREMQSDYDALASAIEEVKALLKDTATYEDAYQKATALNALTKKIEDAFLALMKQAEGILEQIDQAFKRAEDQKSHLISKSRYQELKTIHTDTIQQAYEEKRYTLVHREGKQLITMIQELISSTQALDKEMLHCLEEIATLLKTLMNIKGHVALASEYQEAITVQTSIKAAYTEGNHTFVKDTSTSLIETLNDMIQRTKEKARLAQEAYDKAKRNVQRAKEKTTLLEDVKDLENPSIKNIYKEVNRNE